MGAGIRHVSCRTMSTYVIIIIIMWLVEWTLPFQRVSSMPVDFVLGDIGRHEQTKIEWSDIGFSCPKPSLTRLAVIYGSSPLAKGPHWA